MRRHRRGPAPNICARCHRSLGLHGECAACDGPGVVKARRGSIKRAVQDLAPVAQAAMAVASAAHDGEVPIEDVISLVRAAYRGEKRRGDG